MEQLLEEYAEQLIEKAIADALEGDPHALRLCLDRLMPRCKERTIELEMPPCRSYEEIFAAIAKIREAIGSGQITPSEGEKLVHILQFEFEVAVGADLEARLENIEERLFPNKEEAAFVQRAQDELYEGIRSAIAITKDVRSPEKRTIQDEGAPHGLS